MIKIKSLSFHGILSYLDPTVINFEEGVTQLVGVNGAGKSSIPTILEEALYNKNSRGLKKANLFHRYSDTKAYNIKVIFDVDDDKYLLDKDVTSKTKLILLKNGEDVSGHTATQTYKYIEELIGVDFPTFTKLVYQSMTSSLDFLSATDANRKKFLVSLLGLEKYLEVETKVKEFGKGTKSALVSDTATLSTIESFISDNSQDLELLPLPEATEIDTSELESQVVTLKTELANINLKNSTIHRNNRAAKQLQQLQEVPAISRPEDLDGDFIISHQRRGREITVAKSEYAKLAKVKDTCPTCGQSVDIQDTLDRLTVLDNTLETLQYHYAKNARLIAQHKEDTNSYNEYKTYEKRKEELEQQYDPSIAEQPLEEKDLKDQITSIENTIFKIKQDNKRSITARDLVEKSNQKITFKKEQLAEYESKREKALKAKEDSQLLNDRVDLLIKAVGAKGLIAFKIESIVKEFEALINFYLQEFSDGKFVLEFVMEENNLTLNLYSRSMLVDIKSLSTGEFNKVNTATLLAIRNMLSIVSKVNIDLLFLDEVVSVLDKDGKDTLIEVLLKEKSLNSVLVSHGYVHPLARKIMVIKDGEQSRLDDGQ